MPHNVQNIEEYHEGESAEIYTTVKTESGTIIDLRGAEATWYLKEARKDPDEEAVLEKTGVEGGTEDEIEFPDPENGILKVIINKGDTDGFIDRDEFGTEKEYYHYLGIEDSEGRYIIGFHGDFLVTLP